jgi:hypothetical protein
VWEFFSHMCENMVYTLLKWYPVVSFKYVINNKMGSQLLMIFLILSNLFDCSMGSPIYILFHFSNFFYHYLKLFIEETTVERTSECISDACGTCSTVYIPTSLTAIQDNAFIGIQSEVLIFCFWLPSTNQVVVV